MCVMYWKRICLRSTFISALFPLEPLFRWHFGVCYFLERDLYCHSIYWKGHLITYFIESPEKTRCI